MKRPITEIDLDKNRAGILARLDKLKRIAIVWSESERDFTEYLEKLKPELEGDETVEEALEEIAEYKYADSKAAAIKLLEEYIEEEYTGGIRLEDDDVLTMELPFEDEEPRRESSFEKVDGFFLAPNDEGSLEEVLPLTIFFDSEEEKKDFDEFLKSAAFAHAFERYTNHKGKDDPVEEDPLERVCTQFIESMERLKKEALSKQDEPYYSGKFRAYSEASRDLRKLLRKEKGII